MPRPRKQPLIAIFFTGLLMSPILAGCQALAAEPRAADPAPAVSAPAPAANARLEELHNRTAARLQEHEVAEAALLSPEQAADIAVRAGGGAPLRSIARVIEAERVIYQVQVGDLLVSVDATTGDSLTK